MKFIKFYVAFMVLVQSTSVFAQQELQLSTYFFNPLITNSAYAGSQKSLMINAVVRDQWTGFKGSPKSQVLTIHTPLKGNANMGLGGTLINDAIGAHSNKTITLDYSIGVKLNKKGHRLNFGLKAGLDIYQTNFSKSKIQDNTEDIYAQNFSYTKLLPNAGASLYYYGDKFYLGAGSPRIVKNSYNLPSGQNAWQENHIYLFGGMVFKINSLLSVRPSFNAKYVKNAPLSAEVNLSFFILEKIWLGAMYRHNSAFGANALFYLNESLNIGYAYDYSITQIQRYSNGSHEIMMSYKFKSKSKGYNSPRYF